ncbi:tetratricopeptide repeat protein [Flagellimonas sp.]|uniref:tetratricopeptide repeat protein n=1 Tax=Flagellimonas sp. TaxID=2058762 RepID=UPI003F49D11B
MKPTLLLLLFSIAPIFGQQSRMDKASDLFAGKQYNKAKVILQEEVRNNRSPKAKELLADTYGNLREWNQAIALYEELVTQFPTDAELQFKYGGVLARKAESGSRVKALMLVGKIKKSFLKSAKLNPKHIEVRWGLIEFYTTVPAILGGSKAKAYSCAEELLQISPIEGYFALAYLYGLDDKPKKAEESLRKTIPYFKNLKFVQRNQLNYLIGKVCSDFRVDLENGIAKMKAYIQNYGVRDGVPISQAYYQMAKLYRLKGNREAASIWIRKALRSDSDFKLALEERKIIDML